MTKSMETVSVHKLTVLLSMCACIGFYLLCQTMRQKSIETETTPWLSSFAAVHSNVVIALSSSFFNLFSPVWSVWKFVCFYSVIWWSLCGRCTNKECLLHFNHFMFMILWLCNDAIVHSHQFFFVLIVVAIVARFSHSPRVCRPNVS